MSLVPRTSVPRAVLVWLALLSCKPLVAQGLPAFAPINPVATSRSGLYFQPYREPDPSGWTVRLGVDYASTIEYNRRRTAEYFLDSELLRLSLAAERDLGSRHFILVDASARGAYAGFLDGFLNWYHDLLGVDVEERDRRPDDEFLYRVVPRGGPVLDRAGGDVFLGDVRVGFGRRYSRVAQGVVSVTLPTATGPSGYGRRVVSVSTMQTFRVMAGPRLVYEGSVGVGYTPATGGLAAVQREVFAAATSGLRLRIWGRQALYANLFYHSPYYAGTALPGLDLHELSLDFGWVLPTCRGPEWRVGLTEDLKPSGPGIDLVFRLGVGFRSRTGTAPCAGAGIPSPRGRAD